MKVELSPKQSELILKAMLHLDARSRAYGNLPFYVHDRTLEAVIKKMSKNMSEAELKDLRIELSLD